MQQFGAFEAKTHFSELLSSVIQGERIVITKHGIRVAMLIPFNEVNEKKDQVVDAIRMIRQLRKGVKLGPHLSIKE